MTCISWLSITYAVCIIIYVVDGQVERCNEVSVSYGNMEFNKLDVPRRPQAVNNLRACPNGFSCCTFDMETNLNGFSRKQFDERLANVSQFTRAELITATSRFNDYFIKLVKKGQDELHDMFIRAYGLQYRQNEDVFKQLFTDLLDYYQGANINLADAMKKFFTDVFKRMFRMQNAEYDFTDEYMQCVQRRMEELKPFGDIPDVLSRNIHQAFVAARTFVQGLAVGRNVALKAAEVEPTAVCSEAHMKMTFCPHCQGLPQLKPCNNYCLNVMKGCLAYHAELNDAWTKYIYAMNQLAIRLEGEGAFNIESVINPLKDRISTAIMQYHGNSKDISEKVINRNACGVPSPARHKRESSNTRGLRQRLRAKSLQQLVTLNELVSNIKTKLNGMKDIWSSLPLRMCDGGVTASPSAGANCWNGEAEGRYAYSVMRDGLQANAENREVSVEADRPDPVITKQIERLKEMTTKLNDAKIGINVDWLNLEVPIDAPHLESKVATTTVPILNGFEVMGVDDDIDSEALGVDSSSGMIDSGSGYYRNPWRDRLQGGDDEDGDLGSGSNPKVIPLIPTSWNPNKNRYKYYDSSGSGTSDTEPDDSDDNPSVLNSVDTNKNSEEVVDPSSSPRATTTLSGSVVHTSSSAIITLTLITAIFVQSWHCL